jgi:hypothetical protein
MPNPFTNRSMITDRRQFFGRAVELQSITDTVRRLVAHDYIERSDSGYDFQVPLMREWWAIHRKSAQS